MTPHEHNFSIYRDSLALDEVFRGEFVELNKDITYEIDALPAGACLFRCDLHPLNMKGILAIE